MHPTPKMNPVPKGDFTSRPEKILHHEMFSWRHKREKKVSSDARQLKVLTWNIFFGDDKKIRHPKLLDIVHSEDPDIICFQEVTQDFVNLLMSQAWVRDHYFVADLSNAWPACWYGVMVLSKKRPAKVFRQLLPTRQGRSLLAFEFLINGKSFVVSTIHLESMDNDRDIRKAQMGIIFDQIGSSSSSILCGDCNFGDGPENEEIPHAYVDAWRVLHKTDDPDPKLALGHTFDHEKNPLIPFPITRRLDRVFLRSSEWEVVGMKMLGEESFKVEEKKTWPSDHWGLSCIIRSNASS
ncbi:Endonuclease/Exonuclease/phosphatase family protein [Planoprotostelium fungivorum]|uniref:Endonuclease/Exonuclease/phosphatase family protein n=1 Tax=Planoprotostelium fungivorum TaxID=1890364 RepID=A0A2P6N1K2_9EUKA|nr:Endonuclease/Exonuclease/phosphatase family protein [Planoprotostelium fungivorum]